jgi:hypothetical protein
MMATALTVAGAIAATAISLAPAAASSATTISLVSVQKAFKQVPTGAVIIDVDSTTAGKVVGSDSLNCRVSGPKSAPVCATTVNLPAGDLFLVTTPTKTGATGRVVAGTGAYAGRTGTVLATHVNRSGTKSDVTISLGG